MLEMEAAQAEADRITAEYNVACEDLEAAEIALAKQYEAMKKRVRYIYENGQMEQLELYLKSKSISDILNTSEYIKKINEYDHNLLEKYARMKADVQTRKDILEQQKIAMDSANQMYEEEAKYIQSIIVAKQDAFAKYEELIGANEELLEVYLTELATAQKTLDQAIAEQQAYIKEQEEIRRRQLEEARRREMEEASRKAQQQKQQQQQNGGNNNSSSNVTPQNNAAGITQTDVTDINKMIWPLPGDHRTASKFGPRVPPCAGASSFHKGWDIGGKLGAQIVSVLAGTVTTAGYNSSSGNQVVVNHGNGYSTHYMHMSKILVVKGQKVKQGEVLGLVGSTGVSTAPHLHFSLSKNGTMIDPAPYIQKLQ
ncbi:MAG: peptidoglycan DD-metalloendopeptidase family protein [Lachnospiraceae bacterium]|nr:peptidoglycan DD-metalloendopeptidase family protein [Lachnospiraceae bacterium]